MTVSVLVRGLERTIAIDTPDLHAQANFCCCTRPGLPIRCSGLGATVWLATHTAQDLVGHGVLAAG